MVVTGDTIANEVIMTRQVYSATIFIVEGDKDEKVFRKFTKDKDATIIPAWGKENALDATMILDNENRVGFLTIVDADFWHLDGKYPSSTNIIVTDFHDLEMMIIYSESFVSFIRELCSKTKVCAFLGKDDWADLRDILLDRTRQIGFLRRYSHCNKLGLCFEGLKFERFVDRDTLDVNIEKLVEQVLSLTKNRSLNLSVVSFKLKEMLSTNNDDAFQICCGHDFISILSVGLRKALASKSKEASSSENLESALRLSYDSAHFVTTQLYFNAKNWEQGNSPFISFR